MNYVNLLKTFSFAAICAALPAPAFVYETPHEFSSTGDFDGDGREDIVIVDRATGNYRVGYQLAPEAYSWANTRGSGIEGVTGFSVGRIFDTSRDALVFTSPDANRINVIEAKSPDVAGFPVGVFTDAIGPNLVITLDVGGAGNTAHHDLFMGSLYNGVIAPNRIQPIRNNAGAFTPLPFSALPDRPGAANRVKLKSGTPEMAGLILRGQTEDTFHAFNFSSGVMVPAVQLGALPANVQYVHAQFNGGTPLAQFLFFSPGESLGTMFLAPLEEPLPGDFKFGSGDKFNVGTPIQQVVVLPGNPQSRLLIIFGEGGTAGVYDFDGVNPPEPVQQFNTPAGEHFTGAAALANGKITLFSAAQGATSSSRFQNYNFDGTQYVAGQSGALPNLTVLSSLANVFQFQNEPFVSTKPNLLRSLNAGDWTSGLNTQALPQLSVTVENFLSTSNGVDNPSSLSVGTAHPLTHFGLVNQYAAPLSLFSLSKPVGDEVVEVKIAPPGGTYPASVTVSLTASTPGAQIVYRVDPAGNWLPYNAPFSVFKETTASYYAKNAVGNQKSVIRHATYKFTDSPSELDSDGDGVPDYVEIAKGLNPKSGPDSDGDGYSDLEELLRDTLANDPSSSPPTNVARLELKSSFDLIQTPRPLDGIANVVTTSETNTALRVYELPGAVLRSGVTANLGQSGVMDSAVVLSNIVVDTKQRLLAMGTDAHFNVITAHTNPTLGRELVGLVPVPDIAHELAVPYNYGGGDLATEAANWINSAKTAQSNLTHEVIIGQLEMHDTLGALLVEKKISDLLLNRGHSHASNLTIFPYRSSDIGRSAITQDALLALESLGTNGEPAYRLRTIHTAVQNLLSPATAFNAPLRDVTAEIYRISSALNDVEPGKYASPVNTLREFLWAGVLHSNYLAQTTLTGSDLATAFARVDQLLGAIGNRPTTNITLVVRADTFTGDCTLLDTTLGNGTKSLFHQTGQPYRLLDNFNLPPGSLIYVFGFTDISSHGCVGDPVEVITLGLGSVPAVSSQDTDGDLLLDELEWLLFGGLAQNGNGDADGDGVSNLQEFLDKTDPADPASAGAPADLTPPQLSLQALPSGELLLAWTWPAAYASQIQFDLKVTDALGQPFTLTPSAIQTMAPGQFQIILPNPGGPAKFYCLQLSLK